MKRCFIDSNVIVYANDRNAGPKQTRAIEVIKALMRSRAGVVSIQVLQEYAHTALTKLGQEATVVLRQLRLLESLVVVIPSASTVRRGVEIGTTYQISFWDAAIIAAAEMADTDTILSEDLNTGQFYAGLHTVNPFAPEFDPVTFAG